MLSEYVPILILLIVSTGLAGLIVLISVLFGPRRRNLNATKLKPYESGMNAIGAGQRRFPVRYYLIAVLFILFDIEVIFFYPWAVAFRQLGWFGFIEMLVFMAILFAGYIWVWKKGALEWETMDKPETAKTTAPAASSTPPSTSTSSGAKSINKPEVGTQKLDRPVTSLTSDL